MTLLVLSRKILYKVIEKYRENIKSADIIIALFIFGVGRFARRGYSKSKLLLFYVYFHKIPIHFICFRIPFFSAFYNKFIRRKNKNFKYL